MKYTLETKIRFAVILGTWKEEEFYTMKELGFDQVRINVYTQLEIEEQLQEMYEEWQTNYLDEGWSIVN